MAISLGIGAALTALRGASLASKAAKGVGFLKNIAPLASKAKTVVGGMPGVARKAGQKVATEAAKNADKLKALNMTDEANLLERVRRGVTSLDGFKKNIVIPMTGDDILMTVAPDLLFGGMAAATTEGDLVDKAIAGAGSAVGGIAGGLGARGVLGPKSGLGILGTEMVGGIIGDQVGYGAADSLIRMKHGGMTPAEQSYAQQDAAMRQQIIDEYLAQNGLA